MRFIVLAFLVIAPGAASAQQVAPPPGTAFFSPGAKSELPSFFRNDGAPTDKVILRASRTCHVHNPDAAAAKENCAVFDDQITKRATEPDAKPEIKDQAKRVK